MSVGPVQPCCQLGGRNGGSHAQPCRSSRALSATISIRLPASRLRCKPASASGLGGMRSGPHVPEPFCYLVRPVQRKRGLANLGGPAITEIITVSGPPPDSDWPSIPVSALSSAARPVKHATEAGS